MKSIELNFKRLCDEPYRLQNLFQSPEYDWPGDWEGRALLAFLCHYEINGATIPDLHAFFKEIPNHTNNDGYFGTCFDGVTVDEQQLSGHNWYLRGLIKYAEAFNSEEAMARARGVVEGLYLPAMDWYSHYPLDRDTSIGDVSGSLTGARNGWRLSSDVGCAFMCVDGLAHYYKATNDERVKTFLDKAINLFVSIDLVKYRLQTHTSLTCLRGVLTLYHATKDERYLDIVKEKFAFYTEHGMTLTYENFNWFGREDTWTEPCAVVDSFILATELYKISGEESYRTLCRRIWFNGLQFCRRENGGAGPNMCVTRKQPILKISMYEAAFCCTMRYAEGLLYYAKNEELLFRDEAAAIVTDEIGRRFLDDVLMVEYNGVLTPIFSCDTVPETEAREISLKVF